jgi:hypothetical protein
MADGHALIIGMSESGKTVLAKRLAAWYRRHGIGVAILDPMNDPDWPADDSTFRTDDPAEFLEFVRDPDCCLQAALFIDEAGLSIDKYATEYNWITCQSKHHGHTAHLIAQRAQLINPNIRANCQRLYCFQVPPDDAKAYARDFNAPTLLEAPSLSQGEFLAIRRYQKPQRFRLW